jgi:hypothetical protein
VRQSRQVSRYLGDQVPRRQACQACQACQVVGVSLSWLVNSILVCVCMCVCTLHSALCAYSSCSCRVEAQAGCQDSVVRTDERRGAIMEPVMPTKVLSLSTAHGRQTGKTRRDKAYLPGPSWDWAWDWALAGWWVVPSFARCHLGRYLANRRAAGGIFRYLDCTRHYHGPLWCPGPGSEPGPWETRELHTSTPVRAVRGQQAQNFESRSLCLDPQAPNPSQVPRLCVRSSTPTPTPTPTPTQSTHSPFMVSGSISICIFICIAFSFLPIP